MAKYEVKMLSTCLSYKGWCQLAEETKGFAATIDKMGLMDILDLG